MQARFDRLSTDVSRLTTRAYSTSFSLGISMLGKELHVAVYSIYGFVRFADEIVDSLHGPTQKTMLADFKEETFKAINNRVSHHPILQSFQKVVHQFGIDNGLIESFFNSMEMDLQRKNHNEKSYTQYIYGSAEAVGLMCLHVFVKGDIDLYRRLAPSGRALGSAFQKVNFLRDLKYDKTTLGRTYFPDWDNGPAARKKIEEEIEQDFYHALQGIRQLPRSSRLGVYMAFCFYRSLFNKLRTKPTEQLQHERVRVPNLEKMILALRCWVLVGFSRID